MSEPKMSEPNTNEPERLLTIANLTLSRPGEARAELDGVSLAVEAGETVVILGEAGSGNDTLIRAILGSLDEGETLEGGIHYGMQAKGPQFPAQPVRTAYLPGPSSQPLSPHVSALSQLARIVARRLGAPHSSGRAEFAQELARLDGAPALSAFDKREVAPETLAWGLLAAALAQTPELILVDRLFEGIASKDARALEAALLDAKARLKCTIVCATMTAETAKRLGGRLVVMRNGHIVEEGPIARLSTEQSHAYTQTLLREVEPKERSPQRGQPVVQVFGAGTRSRSELNFELRRGAALALVGAEGSGRHKLTRQVLGLQRLDSGRIVFDAVDIGILAPRMMSRLRRRVAIVSGDDGVLDPRMTLWETVAEPLRAHLHLPRDLEANYREQALRRVGLASLPGDVFTSQLSVFDRRRLQVARAIVTAPALAIIDEPFRGLDAFAHSVIRDLLQSFRAEEGPAFIVVTSDFAVARALADEAMIFEKGQVIERGTIGELMRAPKQLLTRNLVEASRFVVEPAPNLSSETPGV